MENDSLKLSSQDLTEVINKNRAYFKKDSEDFKAFLERKKMDVKINTSTKNEPNRQPFTI